MILANNENPEPVARDILAAIGAGAQLANRYPHGIEDEILAQLAAYFCCPEQNLVLVRGIDEAFDRLSHEFPAMRYATASPGFNGYAGRIRIYGYSHFEIGLTDDFALDTADLDRLTSNDFVVLADPANPTGRPLSPQELAVIGERAGRICIDQTYADYAGSDANHVPFGGKVFTFKSFSKAFGLAGLRLGVLFGEAEIIARIRAKQWYCNVGVLDLRALEAAIARDDLRKAHVTRTVSERERLIAATRALGFWVYPSACNFLLMQDDEAGAIETFLQSHGIMVRNTARFGLQHHVRITIGLPAENDALLAALTSFAGMRKGAYG